MLQQLVFEPPNLLWVFRSTPLVTITGTTAAVPCPLVPLVSQCRSVLKVLWTLCGQMVSPTLIVTF